MNDVAIRRAAPGDVDDLTALAHQSKRHWGYSDELIALWSGELTFTPKYVTQHAVYVATSSQRFVGVYALVRSADDCELDHLWVHPDCMGHGMGRALIEHAISTARAWGVATIKVASDPYAEKFYTRMGARRVGDVPSKPEGRRLPLLRIDL